MERNYLSERFEAVKAMNTLVRLMNDEEAYMEWIVTVPDQADDNDLLDIADDEELFSETVSDFFRIWSDYADEGGLYIGKKLYDAAGEVKKNVD